MKVIFVMYSKWNIKNRLKQNLSKRCENNN